MKKLILMIFICMIALPVWADDAENFEFFDKYLEYYETQIKIGKFLTAGGAGFGALGSIVATIGVSINSATQEGNDMGLGIATAGYICLGTGAVAVVVGLPLWLYGLHRYNYVLEKRDKYFWMIR